MDDNFIKDYWLPRRPTVLSQIVDETTLASTGISKVLSACVDPVKADLYFGSSTPDAADRMRLPRIHEAPAIYQRVLATKRRQIMYFFGLAKVDSGFEDLQRLFHFGYNWRFYDQLASLSTPGSVIHIHIDLIDTMIIQLEGRRRWQVWDRDHSTVRMRALNDNEVVERMRAETDPMIDTELLPGDVLYIPSGFAHQALLDEASTPSLSVSVGWATLTPIRLMRAAINNNAERALLEAAFAANPLPYLEILPDPAAGVNPVEFLAGQLMDKLSEDERAGWQRDALINALRDVNLGSLASASAKGSLKHWSESLNVAGLAGQ